MKEREQTHSPLLRHPEDNCDGSLIHFRERHFGDSYVMCTSKQDEHSIVFRSSQERDAQTFTVWKHMRGSRNPKPYRYVEHIGTRVSPAHPSYFILQCMKIGMIRSLSDPDGSKKRVGSPKYIIDTVIPIDADIAEKHLGPQQGFLRIAFGCFSAYCSILPRNISTTASSHVDHPSGTAPKRVRFRFHFKAHFSAAYSDVRSILKYSPKTIMEQLVGDEWSSTPTPGKSNSLLFFCGSNWVLKTMTPTEGRFLGGTFLPKYCAHLQEYPKTLLPHFVGHFTLTIASGFARQKVSFLLMRNIVPIPRDMPCEIFDLKGSLVDRFTGASTSNRVLKDLDLHYRVQFSDKSMRTQIIDQCARDVQFLQSMCIMDYSLLLGVAPVPREGTYEIVIGFVDVLQEYSLRKRAERWLKSIVYEKRIISCSPPHEYGERLLKFIESIFI